MKKVEFTVVGNPCAKRKYTKKPLDEKLCSTKNRFFENIVIHEGCWNFSCALDKKGYARFRNENGIKVFVHRYSYELFIGIIPDGLVIDHLCRNRNCCNPEHLEAVTNAENIRRGTQGQYQKMKTSCPMGHEYTTLNTYINNGKRSCKE